MIFFTSDLHLHHKNSHGGIVTMCSRPYENVDAMTEDLILRNNEVVSDGDEVWDLGDFSYRCSPELTVEALEALNGKRRIILGNHDKAIRQAYKRGFLKGLIESGKLEIVGGETSIYDDTLAISKMITIMEQKIFMSHYSCRSWPCSFRGSWHIFGHSHGGLGDHYRSFDVGVDGHNFYPWSWDDLLAKMNSLSPVFQEDS